MLCTELEHHTQRHLLEFQLPPCECAAVQRSHSYWSLLESNLMNPCGFIRPRQRAQGGTTYWTWAIRSMITESTTQRQAAMKVIDQRWWNHIRISFCCLNYWQTWWKRLQQESDWPPASSSLPVIYPVSLHLCCFHGNIGKRCGGWARSKKRIRTSGAAWPCMVSVCPDCSGGTSGKLCTVNWSVSALSFSCAAS